jgi:predicted choloylglycine hydrolase
MSIAYVELKGNHYDIGFQHGQQLSGLIKDTVLPLVESDSEVKKISRNILKKIVDKYRGIIGAQFPEIIEETRGIADGAEIDFEKALLTLIFWEVRDAALPSATLECSSFVATGDATEDGESVGSQNVDWPLPHPHPTTAVLFQVQPRSSYRFIGVGQAGNLGRPSVIGFNDKGLGFVGSGIRQLHKPGFGIPPLMITRIGLEKCGTVDEFLRLVGKIPCWAHSGENVDVFDNDGYVARVGFTTKRTIITYTHNHFLASTNHYHDLEMRHFGPKDERAYPSSFARYNRLVELLTAEYGKLNVASAMEIMGDHNNGNVPPDGEKSLCRHGEGIQTRNNMVLRPSEGKIWISDGSPCKGEYSVFSI